MTYFGELILIQTADGKEARFPDGQNYFRVYGNFGAPEIRWLTHRGYRQHGQTEIGYVLEPRTVTLELYSVNQGGRADYWRARAELLDLLRPNRGGLLTLTIKTPGGYKRSLLVRADPGPMFPPDDPDVNTWALSEPLDFLAHDPIWFDPTPVTLSVSSPITNGFSFPLIFPTEFSSEGKSYAFTVNYQGTWETYPRFILDGPYTFARIVHKTLGVSITLNLPIAVGEQRIVDLTPGAQSVVDQNGMSRFSELAPDSDLVNFRILPSGEVPDGRNDIHIVFGGGGEPTQALVQYNVRYFGI